MNKPVLFLVGPTGSGKTELSTCLAKRLGCEIISADSMLVYRGMDIGTAKPSPAVRRRVPHHLIDIVPPRCSFSVYEHRKRALHAIQTTHHKGRIPLVVGGGGLYLKALWKGLAAHPASNGRLRETLEKEAQKKGLPFLYKRLYKIDPARAKGIHPRDARRIVRALEIAQLSGKTPSEWYRENESLTDLGFPVRIFGIERERSELYQRINRRVEEMFRKGLVREVARLKKKGFSKTSGQALGYREVLGCLERGNPAPASLRDLIQANTRHFAKRQLTWFRREKEIHWVRWMKGESCSAVCDKIVKEARPWLENELS